MNAKKGVLSLNLAAGLALWPDQGQVWTSRIAAAPFTEGARRRRLRPED